MPQGLAKAAIALSLSLALGAAWADVSASLVLSDFKVELVDLDQTDGIAPSVDFYGGDVSIFQVRIDLPGPPYALDRYESSQTMFGQGSATLLSGARSGAVSLIGDAFTDTAVLSASVSTAGQGGGGQAQLSFGYPNPNGNFDTVYFNLTPMTRLQISGVAAGEVEVSGTSGGLAHAQFWLELAQPDGGPRTGFVQMFVDALSEDHRPTSGSFEGPANLSFENFSQSASIGRFTGHVVVSAYGVSPVPEPRGGALLIAGLAAIGLLKRRKTRLQGRRGD